jgi:hypothetical protein
MYTCKRYSVSKCSFLRRLLVRKTKNIGSINNTEDSKVKETLECVTVTTPVMISHTDSNDHKVRCAVKISLTKKNSSQVKSTKFSYIDRCYEVLYLC